jgi:hypothetical protein
MDQCLGRLTPVIDGRKGLGARRGVRGAGPVDAWEAGLQRQADLSRRIFVAQAHVTPQAPTLFPLQVSNLGIVRGFAAPGDAATDFPNMDGATMPWRYSVSRWPSELLPAVSILKTLALINWGPHPESHEQL